MNQANTEEGPNLCLQAENQFPLKQGCLSKQQLTVRFLKTAREYVLDLRKLPEITLMPFRMDGTRQILHFHNYQSAQNSAMPKPR